MESINIGISNILYTLTNNHSKVNSRIFSLNQATIQNWSVLHPHQKSLPVSLKGTNAFRVPNVDTLVTYKLRKVFSKFSSTTAVLVFAYLIVSLLQALLHFPSPQYRYNPPTPSCPLLPLYSFFLPPITPPTLLQKAWSFVFTTGCRLRPGERRQPTTEREKNISFSGEFGKWIIFGKFHLIIVNQMVL